MHALLFVPPGAKHDAKRVRRVGSLKLGGDVHRVIVDTMQMCEWAEFMIGDPLTVEVEL